MVNIVKENPLAPAMRIYATNKPAPIGNNWLEYEQSLLRKFIASVGKVIVIGVAVNYADKHIWEELKNTEAEVYLVNKDQESKKFLRNKYGNEKGLINGYFQPSNLDVFRQIVRTSKS